MAAQINCTVSGCAANANRKTRIPTEALCEKHFMRWYRHRDVNQVFGHAEPKSPVERLNQLRVVPVDPHDCYGWSGARSDFGYGHFRFGNQHYSAHRLAYQAAHGAIPEGRYVCHRCDNPSCTNPRHLFVGTARDNNLDMRRKGRHRHRSFRGPEHWAYKLTDEQVSEIIRRRKSGEKLAVIAEDFGISRSYVGNLAAGRASRLRLHD